MTISTKKNDCCGSQWVSNVWSRQWSSVYLFSDSAWIEITFGFSRIRDFLLPSKVADDCRKRETWQLHGATKPRIRIGSLVIGSWVCLNGRSHLWCYGRKMELLSNRKLEYMFIQLKRKMIGLRCDGSLKDEPRREQSIRRAIPRMKSFYWWCLRVTNYRDNWTRNEDPVDPDETKIWFVRLFYDLIDSFLTSTIPQAKYLAWDVLRISASCVY